MWWIKHLWGLIPSAVFFLIGIGITMYLKDPSYQYVAYAFWGIAIVLFGIWLHWLKKMKPRAIPFVASTDEGVHTSVMNIGKTSHVLEVKGGAATHSTVVDGNIQRQHAANDKDEKFIEP